MERLTKYLYKNEPGMDCLKCNRRKTGKCNTSADCAQSAAERLAAIEDILGDDYDLDRMRELVEADRDGRCVVLPVKEGDTVYHVSINPFEDYPPEIFEFPFHITDYYNIGNTVFLTEEAAEAALAREKVCRDCNEGLAKPGTLEKPGERCSDTCERYKAAMKGAKHATEV